MVGEREPDQEQMDQWHAAIRQASTFDTAAPIADLNKLPPVQLMYTDS